MMMVDMLTYLWIDRINAEKLESKAWVPTTKREIKPEVGYACCGTRLHKFRLMIQELIITYRDACRETQSRFNAPSQKSIRAVIVNSIPHPLHYDYSTSLCTFYESTIYAGASHEPREHTNECTHAERV